MCENFVGVTLAIGKLQHTEFLKLSFLYALKWAISPVLLDQVTYDKVWACTVYVQLGVMVFKRSVLESRTKNKSILRTKSKPTIKDSIQVQHSMYNSVASFHC